jgi:hypothetical protein
VNVAADFSALGAKDGNNVLAHAPNLGAGRILFFHRLRHNTEFSTISQTIASTTA